MCFDSPAIPSPRLPSPARLPQRPTTPLPASVSVSTPLCSLAACSRTAPTSTCSNNRLHRAPKLSCVGHTERLLLWGGYDYLMLEAFLGATSIVRAMPKDSRTWHFTRVRLVFWVNMGTSQAGVHPPTRGWTGVVLLSSLNNGTASWRGRIMFDQLEPDVSGVRSETSESACYSPIAR
jgi:hypothetical protein